MVITMDSLLRLVTCLLIITRSVALVVTSGGPVTTFVGRQSEMTCSFSSTDSQGLSFAWSFDGQNGHSDQIGICDITQCTPANRALHQLVISADNGMGRMKLNVFDTVSSDAGNYTCLVSTGEDAQSALVKLKVTACRYGQTGSDCLHDCHCIDGMPCNVFTGRCKEGCEPGWSGAGCQVPSVCPVGSFGVNCTECEVGFTSDSVDVPDSCNSFTGCYNLCSRTCHCRYVENDCNSVTGSCRSGRCHPRWTGKSCQIDRFQPAREKTNPGIAIFSCAILFDSPTNVEPDFVKATTGDFSMDNWEMAKGPLQNVSSTLLNFTFNIQDFPDDIPIYCFIGDPFNKSSEFGYVRLASAVFYVLPSFSGVPEVLEFGYYHAAIGWRQWDSTSDIGDGPIVGYKIYVRSGSNVVLAKEVQPPSMVNKTDRSVSKRSAENASEMVMYNVSGLEAGSTYSVQIAAIRDGVNGEGEQGPALTFTTKQGSIATIVGSSVGAILVIVIVIIPIFIFYKRRSDESATTKSKGKESDSSPQYENPVFDQSKTDVHTYQELNTITPHTYQDLNTDAQSYDDTADPHTYQDRNIDAESYDDVADPHTYQDRNIDAQSYDDIADPHTYQDRNIDAQSYDDVADPHTYQDRNTDAQSYDDTDTHAYQGLNTDAQSYDDTADPHTYQDLKKPDQEANYEELNDAIKRDYVNVPGI